MASYPLVIRRSRIALYAAIAVFAFTGCWFATAACAQQQESGFLDRLDHPDRTLHYSPADKPFEVSSSVTGHEAAVRPFAFSRPATLRAGDGVFSTHAFTGKDSFRTKEFATRTATTTGHGFAQTDKSFSTKGFDVREDRAANKTMPIRDYAPAGKPYLIPGKRQDSIDELRKQKNLTVDQVRELLNKSR